MRVVITRPRKDGQGFAELLQKNDYEPIIFPTITIAPSSDASLFTEAFDQLDRLDWLIFTSRNGVEIFLSRLTAHGESLPPSTKIAVIGKKTLRCLQSFGYEADFMPKDFLGDKITLGLGNIEGKRVLIPSTHIADPGLPTALLAAGASIEILTAYRTIPAKPDKKELDNIRKGVDVITFTSGSTARNFFTIAQENGLDPLHLPNNPAIACIGPITAQVVSELGFPVRMIAKPYTTEGLISTINKYRKEVTA